MSSSTSFRTRVQAGLPPENQPIERNAAITARYAALYRDHAGLFKWAGMAAFGSHRVGVALSPLRIVEGRPCLERLARRDAILYDDIELMRQTNNAIFADIAWTHLVFIERGFTALEPMLSNDPERALLLEGFRQIERGRANRNDALVWSGNELLLKHEQFVIVQRAFDQLDRDFSAFLSLATALDFDADEIRVDVGTNSSFYLYMCTRGLEVLRRTRALPSYVRFDHRWFWLAKRVFPIWRRVDADPAETMRHIATLIGRHEPPALDLTA